MLKSLKMKIRINTIIAISLFILFLTIGGISIVPDGRDNDNLFFSAHGKFFFMLSLLLFVYILYGFFSLKEITVPGLKDTITLYLTMFSIHLLINDIDYDHILRGKLFYDRDFLKGKLKDGTSVLVILDERDHFHVTFSDRRNSISV